MALPMPVRGRRLKLILIPMLILAGVAAGGCTHRDHGRDLHRATLLPTRVEIDGVPFFPQARYQCGPAALAMVLGWSGLAITPEDLVGEVYTPFRRGSLQSGLITAARRLGRLAYVIHGPDNLLNEITAGHPAIVPQNLGTAWHPAWHYAVVLGFDRAGDSLILHTGTDERRAVAWSRFLFTWERSQYWGLVVLPPERLPADENEGAYLQAVLGLEKAGQWAAASRAYTAALQRWPQSPEALIGLGNAHIMQGEWEPAETALRRATSVDPQNGDAANNLAHILARRGQVEEALEWSRRAVAIGGPNLTIYRQTLQEIETMRKQ